MVFTKNEGLRLILKHLNLFSKTWDFMALSKISYSTNNFAFHSSLSDSNNSVCKRRCGLNLNLRSCLNHNEKSAKAGAVSRNRYLANKEEVGLKLVNGNGSCKHWKPSEVGKRSIDDKLAVAVDVDEGSSSLLVYIHLFVSGYIHISVLTYECIDTHNQYIHTYICMYGMGLLYVNLTTPQFLLISIVHFELFNTVLPYLPLTILFNLECAWKSRKN